MYTFVDISKKLFDKFLANESCETFLTTIWALFSYLKKTVLKRKNEYSECVIMLSFIIQKFTKNYHLEEIVKECELHLKKNTLNIKCISLWESINSKISQSIKDTVNAFISSYFKYNLLSSNTQNKISLYHQSEYELVLKKYIEILIPDEIDDLKIFENYFLDKKIKNTPIKSSFLNSKNLNDKLSFSLSTNVSNYYNKFQEKSEANTPSRISSTENFDCFFEELKDYSFLDISFLFKKYSKHITNSNEILEITHSKVFEDFESSFISKYINSSLNEKLELNLLAHKNLFLKLADSLLSREDPSILNKLFFFQNFIVISFYIYLNLLYVEKPAYLDENLFLFNDKLNKYNGFDFMLLFKLINELKDTNIPLSLKTILKNFYNILISSVLWQENSFIFLKYLNLNYDHEVDLNLKQIIKKAYMYSAGNIEKIAKSLNIDNYLRERVWIVMKYIFSVEFGILKNNFLDALIICAFYVVLKREGEDIKFSLLIQK